MILSASGGLVYHARALLGFGRWEAARRSVSELVSDWTRETGCEQLIIFGPSGGYLLTHDLFGPINLTVIDPDYLASIVFRRRFPSSRIKWQTRSDLLPFTSHNPNDFFNFIALESATKKTAVLFLGLLGQIDLHKSEFTRTKAEATRILLSSLEKAGLPWASLHDLESAILSSPPSAQLAAEPKAEARARIEQTTSSLAFENVTARTWLDHETTWIGPPRKIIVWMLSRKRLHHLGWFQK